MTHSKWEDYGHFAFITRRAMFFCLENNTPHCLKTKPGKSKIQWPQSSILCKQRQAGEQWDMQSVTVVYFVNYTFGCVGAWHVGNGAGLGVFCLLECPSVIITMATVEQAHIINGRQPRDCFPLLSASDAQSFDRADLLVKYGSISRCTILQQNFSWNYNL